MLRALLTLGVLALPMSTAPGQKPVLVKDMNTTPYPNAASEPGKAVRLGKDMFFAATTLDYGRELYRSVGGITQPTRVRDIVPGTLGSWPASLTVMGKELFFSVRQPGDLYEVWKSKGSPAGTQRLERVGAKVDSIAVVGAKLFIGTSGGLWASDGTSVGTKQIAKVPAAALTAAGKTLFFRGSTATQGKELWKSDGTASGTVLVKDINPGPSSSHVINHRSSYAFRKKLLFLADDGSGWRNGLWVTDGTAKGTTFVKYLGTTAGWPPRFVEMGSRVYVTCWQGLGQATLWVSDGTPAGTQKIKDLLDPPWAMVRLGKAFYFMQGLLNPSSQLAGLWRSDGTTAGTVQVASIPYPGLELVQNKGTLFFQGYSSLAGRELWKSDGTKAGTTMVADLSPGKTGAGAEHIAPAANGGVLYASWHPTLGEEMAVSDGTKAGTRFLGDIKPDPGNTQSSLIHEITDHAGTTMVGAQGMWVTDGTSAGTVLLAPGDRGWASSTSLGEHVYFPSGVSRPLIKSDGTASGTIALSALAGSRRPVTMGGHVYYNGYSPKTGWGLWKTDGTTAGTSMVASLGSYGPVLREFVATKDKVFFWEETWYLWCSDGTAQGTFPLNGSKSKVPWLNVSDLRVMGDILYFSSGSPWKLCRSDGTPAGTLPVKDSQGTYPSPISIHRASAAVGSVLYFGAITAKSRGELWRTDGTPAGTFLVKAINPGTGSSTGAHITGLTASGQTVFFFADDGKHGWELWKTDGTRGGTVLVKDIWPGSYGPNTGGSAEAIVAVGPWVYFAADDGVHGWELWRSDGTAAGTVMVDDLVKGDGSSHPHRMTVSRGTLFFAATDPRHGFELWRVDAVAHAQQLGAGCARGRLPALSAGTPALGATLAIGVKAAAAARQNGVLVIGIALSRPSYLGGGCSLYVDLAQAYLPLVFQMDKTGRWTLQARIPNQPALSGVMLPMQAGIDSKGYPPIGVDLSAGLLLAIR